MILTAQMPDGMKVNLDVADATLVYNGFTFVAPAEATYVALYMLPVDALSADHRGVRDILITERSIRARVTQKNQTSVPSTDPLVIAAPDPSGGECVCGITCHGTVLRFVTVTQEIP